MHITVSEFEQLDETSLLEFLGRNIPEGRYVDYKQDLDLSSSEKRREFVKDIVGFANADGGIIIYGALEPEENVGAQAQLIGVDDGDSFCQQLERMATDTCDPRIPGFRIRSFPLGTGGKWAIVALIPKSSIGPHMVLKQRFHIRQDESTNVMTQSEVVQKVLSTYNRATYIEEKVAEVVTESEGLFFKGRPGFVLQAVPQVALTVPWDVYSGQFDDALTGTNRANVFRSGLCLFCGPRSIFGICSVVATDKHDIGDSSLLSEIFNDGRIVVRVLNQSAIGGDDFPKLAAYKNQLFCAFGHLVDEVLALTNGGSTPYIIFCSYVNSAGTKLWVTDWEPGDWADPMLPPLKNPLTWPEVVVPGGHSAQDLCADMGKVFYYAFGYQPPSSLPTKK